MRFPAGLLALSAIAALGAAGCGSSDDETTVTLSKQEFTKQANAICAKGNKEINQAGNKIFADVPPNQQPSQAQIEKFASETLVPSVEKQVAAIDALPVPSGDDSQVQAILDAANKGIDEAKKDPSSLAGNGDPFKEANKLANDYGMKACGG